MLVKHLMCITIPAIEGEFDEHKYQVPIYAGGNNTYNMDPVKHIAFKALADEFASEDPDLHKHFMEKGIVTRFSLVSAPSDFMLADIYDIKEVENFDDIPRSKHW